MKGILNKALSLALLISAFPAVAMNADVEVVSAALARQVAEEAVVARAGLVATQAVVAPVANAVSASSNFVVAQAQQGGWFYDMATKTWKRLVDATGSLVDAAKAHPKTAAAIVAVPVVGTGLYMLYNKLGNKANKPADAKQVAVSVTDVTILDAMLQAVTANDVAGLQQGSTRLTSDVVKNMQFGNPEKGGELYPAYTYLNNAIKNLNFINVRMGKERRATAAGLKAQQAYLTNYIDAMRDMVLLAMPAQPVKAPVVAQSQEVAAANKPATPAQVKVEAPKAEVKPSRLARAKAFAGEKAGQAKAKVASVATSAKNGVVATAQAANNNKRTIGLAAAGTAAVGGIGYAAYRYLGK